jgi:hypothetical protein
MRAALETSQLSSSIWKRVTTSPVIVRMIANCVAMILPVAFIWVCSAPMIAARLLFARMSSTSKVTASVSVRRDRRAASAYNASYRPRPARHHAARAISQKADINISVCYSRPEQKADGDEFGIDRCM